jgi:hypothetical protein
MPQEPTGSVDLGAPTQDLQNSGIRYEKVPNPAYFACVHPDLLNFANMGMSMGRD